MSDFSDRPFAAGSMFGLRAFRVDGLGRLTGVSHQSVWTPGENVAECLQDRAVNIYARLQADLFNSLYGAGGYSIHTTPPPTSSSTRFWSSSWPSSRTSPAALRQQADQAQRRAQALIDAEQAENAEESMHTVAALDCKCGFYAYFDGSADYYETARDEGVALAAVIEGYGVCTTGSRGFRASKARIVALIVPPAYIEDDLRTSIRVRKVLRNYPDVPVYASDTEAIAAHPLTEDSTTPETCDDFWTRSAS
ncbi:hypothetical protein [Luteipulveratus mongoliensis]|uniref:Uncharacterized protein n=1 Tax=Luteipulveratus mongoliensis TaxID=571913 RepID=A0A0K1JGF7_9MICO|nr:hypothetical protein [Luteipulveratus mongoliensis]AKU15781.1 hypothetical protein VV02_07800 [Luteipulveratus mongoliensis]